MAVRTPHIALTLRGDSVSDGIDVSQRIVPFTPKWGMTRDVVGLLASVTLEEGILNQAYIGITDSGVVLAPVEESANPTKELVLVQMYSPGVGAKRWPSFQVEFGPETRILSRISTSGGSGGEEWVLVTAPLGWAHNIATQFINERDYEDQVVSHLTGNDEDEETETTMTAALRAAGLI